jgi:hypothetical protein
MGNKNLKNIIIFISIVIILIIIIYYVSQINNSDVKNSDDIVENVSMKIITSSFYINYENISTINKTVADFLFECAENYNFSVKKQFWGGNDSFYIEAINGTKNGFENNYWQFYVNGKFADISCSDYILKNNDIVEWRFEKSPWE